MLRNTLLLFYAAAPAVTGSSTAELVILTLTAEKGKNPAFVLLKDTGLHAERNSVLLKGTRLPVP
jgi:hypothetical protein